MPKRQESEDIGSMKTDLDWIKKSLGEIKDMVNDIKLCTDGHDDRISKVEEWVEARDEEIIKERNSKEWSLKKVAIVLSAFTIVFNVIGWVWFR